MQILRRAQDDMPPVILLFVILNEVKNLTNRKYRLIATLRATIKHATAQLYKLQPADDAFI